MRASLVPLIVGVLVVGCARSDGDSGRQPVLDTTTIVTIEAPLDSTTPTTPADSTTTTPTTSSTTSTTSTPLPLTVDEPATTAVPADIDKTFAEAFAAYEEAWAVRQESARAPTDPEIRARIEDLYVDPFLSQLLDGLDAQAAEGFVNVLTPDREAPSVTFVEAIATTDAGLFAEFAICEVLTERVVDSATEEVIFDEVLALSGLVRMRLEDGAWRVTEEVSTQSEVGTQCTP